MDRSTPGINCRRSIRNKIHVILLVLSTAQTKKQGEGHIL